MFCRMDQSAHLIRLVLLDVDGTLIDSRAAILAAYRAAFAATGVSFEEDDRSVARLLAQRVHEACVERAGDRAAACAQAYRDTYRSSPNSS